MRSNTSIFLHLRSTLRPSEGAGVSLWKVLVLGDNPTVRKLICELFVRGLDFAVCGQGQDGRDALIQAQKLKPNLIVTDLNMPFMNGW